VPCGPPHGCFVSALEAGLLLFFARALCLTSPTKPQEPTDVFLGFLCVSDSRPRPLFSAFMLTFHALFTRQVFWISTLVMGDMVFFPQWGKTSVPPRATKLRTGIIFESPTGPNVFLSLAFGSSFPPRGWFWGLIGLASCGCLDRGGSSFTAPTPNRRWPFLRNAGPFFPEVFHVPLPLRLGVFCLKRYAHLGCRYFSRGLIKFSGGFFLFCPPPP